MKSNHHTKNIEENFLLTLNTFEIGFIKQYIQVDIATGRKRVYGFIQTISLSSNDLYFHKNDIYDESIKQDDIVIYKYGKNSKGKVAKGIILLKDNQASLKSIVFFIDKFGFSNNDFFKTYQLQNFLKFFLSKEYILNMEEDIFLKLVKLYNNKNIFSLFDEYFILNGKFEHRLVEYLFQNINNQNITLFMNMKSKNKLLEYHEIKSKIENLPKYVELKYISLIKSINKCQNYKHINVSFQPNEIYNKFTDNDYILAKQWIIRTNNYQFEYAKMISARGAEIASKEFYEKLNFKVHDTAITQINKDCNDWKLFDLHLGDKRVDVKNSRSVMNEKLSYTEHCIPKFKQTRTGQIIDILGVVSPYFRLQEDENKLSINRVNYTNNIENMITILGETSLSKIDSYAKRFTKNELEVNLNQTNFIPDWTLEYPMEFYSYREQHKSIFLDTYREYPTSREYALLKQNLIPFFLSCGLDLPFGWDYIANLTKEQINFYNRLKFQGKKTITKPFLYLAILKHFSERLKKNSDSYKPSDYIILIYSKANFEYPLGIYDPTLIIKKHIDTLDTLWAQKKLINMSNYYTFKYNQKGILQAKKSMEKTWDTLIAYCGGFIQGKGSCGYKPLIKGKHKTCGFCNKIICPKCNFCMDKCKRPMSDKVYIGADDYL